MYMRASLHSASAASNDPKSHDIRRELIETLEAFPLPIDAGALVRSALGRARRSGGQDRQEVVGELEKLLCVLLAPPLREDVIAALGQAPHPPPAAPANVETEVDHSLETIAPIGRGTDPSSSRALAREACIAAGLSRTLMHRVISAVGELSRNISTHVGEGQIRFRPMPERARLELVAEDEGPGIAALEAVLAGRYRGRNGLARGLVGVQRLADSFEIQSGPEGTRVELAFVGRR